MDQIGEFLLDFFVGGPEDKSSKTPGRIPSNQGSLLRDPSPERRRFYRDQEQRQQQKGQQLQQQQQQQEQQQQKQQQQLLLQRLQQHHQQQEEYQQQQQQLQQHVLQELHQPDMRSPATHPVGITAGQWAWGEDHATQSHQMLESSRNSRLYMNDSLEGIVQQSQIFTQGGLVQRRDSFEREQTVGYYIDNQSSADHQAFADDFESRMASRTRERQQANGNGCYQPNWGVPMCSAATVL